MPPDPTATYDSLFADWQRRGEEIERLKAELRRIAERSPACAHTAAVRGMARAALGPPLSGVAVVESAPDAVIPGSFPWGPGELTATKAYFSAPGRGGKTHVGYLIGSKTNVVGQVNSDSRAWCEILKDAVLAHGAVLEENARLRAALANRTAGGDAMARWYDAAEAQTDAALADIATGGAAGAVEAWELGGEGG